MADEGEISESDLDSFVADVTKPMPIHDQFEKLELLSKETHIQNEWYRWSIVWVGRVLSVIYVGLALMQAYNPFHDFIHWYFGGNGFWPFIVIAHAGSSYTCWGSASWLKEGKGTDEELGKTRAVALVVLLHWVVQMGLLASNIPAMIWLPFLPFGYNLGVQYAEHSINTRLKELKELQQGFSTYKKD